MKLWSGIWVPPWNLCSKVQCPKETEKQKSIGNKCKRSSTGSPRTLHSVNKVQTCMMSYEPFRGGDDIGSLKHQQRHLESVVHQQSLLCLTIKAACLKFSQFCPTRISECDLLAYLGNILKQKLQTSANDKTENEIYKHFNRIMFKDLFSTLNLRYCKRKRVGCLPIY